MPLKFKQRECTKQICVVTKSLHGANRDTIYRQQRRLGELDTNYHIILLNNGLKEFDRDIKAVAGYKLPENTTSIYVLVDAKDKKHINDAQSIALQQMSIEYDLPIKYMEV